MDEKLPEQTVEEAIKHAELKKLIAESEKFEIEKRKVENEILSANIEQAKKWWERSKFWQQILTVFLGVSILSFYITYIVIPTASINNLKLELENARKSKQLYYDSLHSDYVKKQNDSIRRSLDERDLQIANLAKAGVEADRIYNSLRLDSKKDKEKIQKIKDVILKALNSTHSFDSLDIMPYIIDTLPDVFVYIPKGSMQDSSGIFIVKTLPQEPGLSSIMEYTYDYPLKNLKLIPGSYKFQVFRNGEQLFESHYKVKHRAEEIFQFHTIQVGNR